MNGKEPKAYKDGAIDFYGRSFIVNPAVLIPRSETEAAIDLVLSLAGKEYLPGVKVAPSVLPKIPKILDVGTGSGCIAITLKLELENADVTAVDISSDALEIAKKNASVLGADVKFMRSDLLNDVSGDFDVIVANLPYVDENWDWLDKEALEFEPELALYAGDGGLEIISKFLEQAIGRTKYLILEADPCQHSAIISSANGFKLVKKSGFQLLFAARN